MRCQNLNNAIILVDLDAATCGNTYIESKAAMITYTAASPFGHGLPRPARDSKPAVPQLQVYMLTPLNK